MKTVALFFGGLSNEAEVSIMSAKNVVKYFDYQRYKLILIYWCKADACFYRIKDINSLKTGPKNRINIEQFKKLFDIAFPVTHGRYGEDGVLQAIFESQKIKYCGCRVLSSALCMDKFAFKNLMSTGDVNQVKYIGLDFALDTPAELKTNKEHALATFRFPLYVKPANSGSSVGVSKVNSSSALDQAIREARRYDRRVIIEEGLVVPKEIEVAVIGNEKLIVSRPGELQLAKEFYDYDDKYKLGEAQVIIPAKISPIEATTIRELAARAYRLAACSGFARVDFFISGYQIYLNEINTIPGFTDISMFPMLMMQSGWSYKKLLNEIIRLAF